MSIYSDAVKITDNFLIHVKHFEKVNGKFDLASSYKKMILFNARDLVYWNPTDKILEDIIEGSKSLNPKDIESSYNISDYLKKYSPNKYDYSEAIVENNELLKFGKFYYHPLLQKSSAAPKFILDSGMNLIEAPREKFYLENINSFTLEDLNNYFIEKTKRSEVLTPNFNEAMTRIVNHYGLDLTLYMIDFAVQYATDEQLPMPRSPQYLLDNVNLSGAITMYNNRKNACFEEGLVGEIAK